MATVNTTAWYIERIRQVANAENDPIVSDTELAQVASDGLMSLYDLIVAAYEHYAVKKYPFTLAGGIGANTAPYPDDFYKDVALTLNPTRSPITIHRYSSYVERNNLPRLEYMILDNYVEVGPAASAAGTYELAYTPIQKPLALPLATPAPNSADAVDGTLKSWFFTNGAFNSTYVGATMVVTGCTNAANNGTFTVLSVTGPTDIRTDGVPASEVFGVAATVTFQPAGTLNALPPIFTPWREYIWIYGGRYVLDKKEQDTTDIAQRLAELARRIEAMASNRMEEGGQVPLARGNNFAGPGGDAGWPWGGGW